MYNFDRPIVDPIQQSAHNEFDISKARRRVLHIRFFEHILHIKTFMFNNNGIGKIVRFAFRSFSVALTWPFQISLQHNTNVLIYQIIVARMVDDHFVLAYSFRRWFHIIART